MSRHPEPEFVKKYKAMIKGAEIPRVCTTCDNYSKDGLCLEFDTEPPELFTRTLGTCDLWSEEVPF